MVRAGRQRSGMGEDTRLRRGFGARTYATGAAVVARVAPPVRSHVRARFTTFATRTPQHARRACLFGPIRAVDWAFQPTAGAVASDYFDDI
jgi:hypothetical protein